MSKELGVLRMADSRSWQPIESAPKDGTEILALWTWPNGGGTPSCAVAQGNVNGQWFIRGRETLRPDHWMLLPDPPENI